MTLKLAFGYNAGIPADATAAWGARLIVTQDGAVDYLHDRTDAVGDTVALFRHSAAYPFRSLRADLAAKLAAGEIKTNEAAEVVLYEDERIVAVGNSNASHGYFYVTIALKADPVPAGWRHRYPARTYVNGIHRGPGPWLDVIHEVNGLAPGTFGGSGPESGPRYGGRAYVEEYPGATVVHNADGTVSIIAKDATTAALLDQADESLSSDTLQT